MYGRPARAVEQVKADDAVGVDVRVPRDRVVGVADEGDFWGLAGGRVSLWCGVELGEDRGDIYLDGVLRAEGEFEAVGFV